MTREVELEQIRAAHQEIVRENLDLRHEVERLRTALENVSAVGHNNECLFCAAKDFNAQKAVGGDRSKSAKDTGR